MKFHFEQLGLLDDADIELADLTLICGENNTGKTYATYAVYGFLRSWRQILRFLLEDEINRLLADTNQYRIDLALLFDGKVDSYLERMGKAYVSGLPRALAAESNVFENTICVINSCKATDFLTQAYQRTVQADASGKVLATLNKEAGNTLLDVLVADAEGLQQPFGGLTDFIINAMADIVFAEHLPRVHSASAERTGAAIFRKELDMARTRMLKAIHQIDSKELKR
ncbi:MAG: AAA family ATPase, partial [Methylococcaceae bacterium]